MKKLLFAMSAIVFLTFVGCDKGDEKEEGRKLLNGLYGLWGTSVRVNGDEVEYILLFEDNNQVKGIRNTHTSDGEKIDGAYGSYVYDKPNVTIDFPDNIKLHGTYDNFYHLTLYNDDNEEVGTFGSTYNILSRSLANYIWQPITDSIIGDWYDSAGNLQLQIFEDGTYTRPGYPAKNDFKWYFASTTNLVFTNTAFDYTLCSCSVFILRDGLLRMSAFYYKSLYDTPYKSDFFTLTKR